MQRTFALIEGVLILLLLAACGPSPEQIATMTASAWTPTPVPPTATPTPTPVPIDLTVTISDESGAPVAGANIVFPETGNSEPVQSDAQGKFNWTNLAGEAATFKVSAQGYFSADQSATLQRGPNEVSIALKRDPFAFLSSNACGAGEKLLYMEDFQDGIAQDYISEGRTINDGITGVSLGAAPNENGNTVLILDSTQGKAGDWMGINLDMNRYAFGDAVWRLRFMVNMPTAPVFDWNQHGPSEFDGQEVQATVYDFRLWGAPSNTIHLHRQISGPSRPAGSGEVASGTFTMQPGQWHYMEISTLQGHYQAWIDGESELDYQDPTPLPAGSLGVWFAGQLADKNTGIIYADAFAVCGLSAPFASMLSPIPAP